MALRFRPVDSSFYDLFAESARHLVVGANLLAEMLADGADHQDVARRMREAEHAADETTHALVRRVNTTFVTPLDREDIYALGSGLDDVMDLMDEVVDMILLYEVKALPPKASVLDPKLDPTVFPARIVRRSSKLCASSPPTTNDPINATFVGSSRVTSRLPPSTRSDR